jgi:hypothetical protein
MNNILKYITHPYTLFKGRLVVKGLMCKKPIMLGGIFVVFMLALLSVCTKDNPVQSGVNDTWTITGNVQDGSSGAYIDSALVEYSDRNGKLQKVWTTNNGDFTCPDLPSGSVGITVIKSVKDSSVLKDSVGKSKVTYTTKVPYTTTVLQVSSGSSTASNDSGSIRDTSVVVKLFKLTGSVSGTVKARKHAKASQVVASHVQVKITYPDTSDMKYASPRIFTSETDSTGAFKIENLPIAKNAILTVLSSTVDSLAYCQKVQNLNSDLSDNSTISAGTIVLDTTVEGKNFHVVSNNFPSSYISPTGVLTWTLSDKIDSSASYAVVESGILSDTSNVGVTTKVSYAVSGNTFSVTPSFALVNNQAYKVRLYLYGKKGGDCDTLFSVTAYSVGLEEVTSSNALTSGKEGVSGFSLNDSMTFTLNDSLKDVIVAVSHIKDTIIGYAKVKDTIVDLVTVTFSGKNIVIKSQGSWLSSTVYIVQISGTLANGTPVSFQTTVTTEGGLNFVTSNVFDPQNPTVGITGFVVGDSIVITANKALSAASAILSIDTTTGTQVPVTVSVSGSSVVVKPKTVLTFATKYILQFSMTSTTGEVKNVGVNGVAFTTVASGLYLVSCNACIGTNTSSPVLNFDPLENIVVVMSKQLSKATAQITDSTGTVVLSTVTIINGGSYRDTVVIDPQSALVEGMKYTIKISVEDVDGETYSETLVTGLTPVRGVYIVASNVLTKDTVSLQNVSITTTPWYKLSVTPVASSMKANITSSTIGNISNTVTVSGDTLFIAPSTSFRYGDTVTVSFDGIATNGKAISLGSKFYCTPTKTIRVVWSNVLNANLEGLTGVAVNQPIKVLLSSKPKAGTITKTDITGSIGNSVITVSGDTIVVTPVTNLAYETSYRFLLKGNDTAGNLFADTIPSSGSFTTTQNVFVVASNLLDANGNPLKTFPRYGTMWIKFSEALSTDKTQYAWAAYTIANAFISSGALQGTNKTVVGEGTATSPNATVSISGDTLFVTPDNRLSIGYGDSVGFDVTITTATGKKTKTFGAAVKTAPLNLYILATNTKDANGIMREDFGLHDTVWVKSSVAIDSLIAVNDSFANIPDVNAGLLRSRTWLSATKDTIFYVPSAKLTSATKYGLDFNVRLSGEGLGTTPHSNVLGISWKTKSGVYVTAINNMTNSTTFRPIKVIGDSLVVSFSKAIDTNYNASTPFKVNGGIGKYTTSWSADLKTVTIKNIDTLIARPYSVSAADLTTNNTTYNYTLTFNVTCADGEEKSALAGANQSVGVTNLKTEYALALIGSNTVLNHTTAAAIASDETLNDTFAVSGNPVLVFNRAVDTVKIKADAANQYGNFITLKKVSGIPLEFSVSFSSDAKTVTLDPVSDFTSGSNYDIIITNVTAIGLRYANAFSGSASDNSILTNADFTVKSADTIISALTDSLRVDTVSAALNILGNRQGYSAEASVAYLGTVVDTGKFIIDIHKVQWGPHYADSVDGYQIRVRSSSGDWHILSTLSPKGTAYNQFSSTLNTSDAWVQTTVDVASDAAAYSSMLVANGGTNYSNASSMLNHGTNVQIQARAYKAGSSSDTSYAVWSNAVTFADNVAPGDSDYNVPVTIAPSLTGHSTSAIDSVAYVTLTFPEDMDVSTVPTIAFYNGASSTLTALAKAANSGWTSARTYNLYIKLGAGDYTSSGWYFSVSVAGMKDYSGVTLQSTGSVGDAAAGTAIGSVTGAANGNVNVGGLQSF